MGLINAVQAKAGFNHKKNADGPTIAALVTEGEETQRQAHGHQGQIETFPPQADGAILHRNQKFNVFT